jgi:hypothetical protein
LTENGGGRIHGKASILWDGSRAAILRGVNQFISCYTALQRLNGHVKLLHLNNHLQYLLAITNLDSVFEIFDSEPTAVSSFAPCIEKIEDAAH